MAEHTVGPWIAYQQPYSSQMQIRDDAGEIIIAVVPEKGNKTQCRADALLIAAAPDLLTALHETLDSLRQALIMLPHLNSDDITCLPRADAAIAKAEGRT